MQRGTTPTLTFTLPFETEGVDVAFVSFSQKGVVVLDKRAGTSGCECGGKKITVLLTQEETLKLKANQNVDMQIRIRMVSGAALASKVITIFVEDVIKDGVI